MNNDKIYTFKPMNFNEYGYDFFDNMDHSNYYVDQNQRINGNCPCENSSPQRPCSQFPPQRPCSSQRPCSPFPQKRPCDFCPPQNGIPPFVHPQMPCRCMPPQNNFPPFVPPQRPCLPCVNPISPPFQGCGKDNFRYFLIGYLFGSKDWYFCIIL